MRSAAISAWMGVGASALCGVAFGQSVPIPGAPSQPFTPVAQAQNGGAGPQVTYQYGMEFVTINGGGNAYPGSANDFMPLAGRGGLNYDYRVSRYEVGAASWSAFFSAAQAVQQQTGQALPFISSPGSLSSSGQYGRVGNISWRTAAMYCNWLCNGQAVTREAFMNGAYDVSTFGYIGNVYTDQLTHNPNAQFWIPTLDEWIRAAHYDPNRNGSGQGGWWQYSISRDTMAGPGLPGQSAVFPFGNLPGEANAGFTTPNLAEFHVPLGAYSNVQSPWGLFDTVGQSTEWLEESWGSSPLGLPLGRMHAGAYLTGSLADVAFGSIGNIIGQTDPSDDAYWYGLRIAAVIPSPGGLILFGLPVSLLARRHRGAHIALRSVCRCSSGLRV